jgi:hypothetical protein
MPVTFNDMVNDVQSLLFGYVRSQEQATYLKTSGVSAADTTWTVNDPSRLSRGLAEVDDELVWIDTIDRSAASANVTLPPFGRGYLGTTAASHSVNAKVTFAPLFPRSRVKRAINDTILAVSNDLFAVGSTTFTFTSNIVTYSLPADVKDVLQVSFDTTGPSQMWYPLSRWRFDAMANVTDFATGKTIDIYEPVTSGRTVQVKYQKFPSEMSTNADVFTTTTGLLESVRDCIMFGAAARLVSGVDSQLLNTQAVEANVLDDRSQPGVGGDLSRQFYQLHKQRLMEERQRLIQMFPIMFHYAR